MLSNLFKYYCGFPLTVNLFSIGSQFDIIYINLSEAFDQVSTCK